LLAHATYSTLHVPIETKNSTYSRRSQTVSTVKSRRQGSSHRVGAGTIAS
jgi:hypothetical protein